MRDTFGNALNVSLFGESHGKAIGAVVDGIAAGITFDPAFLELQMDKRRARGDISTPRQEGDVVQFLSGVVDNVSTGTAIALMIENTNTKSKDYSKTQYVLRPGHADFAGSKKYGCKDLRDILERSSARKTAIEVAVGAVAQLVLKEFGINFFTEVLQVGCAYCESDIHIQIDKAKEQGDTIGGKFSVTYQNLPVGLGSCVHWDRKIDGLLAQAVMSVPAVKSVTIGSEKIAESFGSEYHDEFLLTEGEIERITNHAGGVEGGMTNGQDLVVISQMKPIPTMKKALKSVDMKTKTQAEAHFERSDTCAVEACSVVVEAKIACVLIDEFLRKFGGDSLEEIKKHYEK